MSRRLVPVRPPPRMLNRMGATSSLLGLRPGQPRASGRHFGARGHPLTRPRACSFRLGRASSRTPPPAVLLRRGWPISGWRQWFQSLGIDSRRERFRFDREQACSAGLVGKPGVTCDSLSDEKQRGCETRRWHQTLCKVHGLTGVVVGTIPGMTGKLPLHG